MENFIIGLFSEQLSTYIHGFRKEQVTASLLSGKGEISEVHIKVEPINEKIGSYVPFIKLASVYISKLSFNVTSVRNIRKSPIEVSIDEIHVVLVERLDFIGQSEESWKQLAKSFVEKAKKMGSYGLIERIRDNITIDINRVYITFQPMGRFKTRRIGAWSPPAISFLLNNIRGCTVDEYGEEGSPDDVWRHNTRRGRQENMIRSKMNSNKGVNRILEPRTNMIFKKLTCEASIGIGTRSKGMNAEQSFMSSHVLFANVPVQTHLAMHRRLKDNALLAAQLDVSLSNVELIIEPETLPLLTHTLVGLKFCFVKDRSFTDPLGDDEIDESASLSYEALPSYNIENDTTEMSDNDDITQNGNDEINNLDSDGEEDDDEYEEEEEESASVPQSTDDKDHNSGNENWPAFILPSGLIIVEKLCASFSLHNFSIRTKYDSNVNGYLQYTMKGFLTEFIWPKPDTRTGGYVQLSLSYFNLIENYNNTVRTIINGGNFTKSKLNEGKQTTHEETFPTMESLDVRSDPFDLRTVFPVQAFSVKATIDSVNEDILISASTQFFVQYEVGMNSILLTVYPDILAHMYDHFWTKGKNNFDLTWFSGEWQNEVTMESLDIEQYFQPLPKTVTGEIELSSKFYSVTMKILDLKIKIPAPLTVDLKKSSDIVVIFADTTMIISSALPRLFLADHILASSEDEQPDFDVPEVKSTLRVQTTMNGFTIEVLPSRIFNTCFTASQKVLQFKAITLLASLERIQRLDHDVGKRYNLFLSSLLHHVQFNIDFDILAGAMNTVLHYVEILYKSYMTIHQQSKLGQNSKLSFISSSLTLILRLSLSKIDGRLWQHHIPIVGTRITSTKPTPLLHIDAETVELGVIADVPVGRIITIINHVNRFAGSLVKLCLSTFETKNGQGTDDSIHKEIDILCIEKEKRDITTKNITIHFHRHDTDNLKQFFKVNFDLKSSTLRLVRDLDKTLIALIQSIPNLEGFLPSKVGKNIERNITRHNDINKLLEIYLTLLGIDVASVGTIVVEVQLSNSSIVVPVIDKNQSICVICEAAQIVLGFFKEELSHHLEEYWLKLFRDRTYGLHFYLNSRQRISLLQSGHIYKELIQESPSIVESFDLDSYLHPSNFQASLNRINISSIDIISLEVIKELRGQLARLNCIITPLTYDKKFEEPPIDISGPVSIACQTSIDAIESAAKALNEVNEELLLFKEKAVNNFVAKNMLVADLHSQLFSKEVDRVNAFSLLVNDACGYIRVGSAALNHQRIVSMTNFWQYWVVLKKKQLIVYKNPSEATPIDSVNLDGAQLLALNGGGAKRRDLQKGFAIIDCKGEKRFFIAATYGQYENWVSAISKSLQDQSSISGKEKIDSDNTESEGRNEFVNDDNDNISITDSQSMISVESQINDGYDIERSKRFNLREKAKNKMSQIGTAMKNNVKIDTNAIRQLNSGTFQTGQISKVNSTTRLELPSLKIRGLKNGTEAPVVKKKITHKDQKMCAMVGAWFAKVVFVDNDIQDYPSFSRGNITIELKCYQWKVDCDQPCDIVVSKNFSELLSFHTDLSNSLIRIRHDTESAGLTVTKNNTDDLFSQVLHSGRLVKGLLAYIKQENNFFLAESICEALEHFFNAILSTPLPIITFKTAAEFFNIQDPALFESRGTDISEGETSMPFVDFAPKEIETKITELLSIVENIQFSLSKAKKQATIAASLSPETFSISNDKCTDYYSSSGSFTSKTDIDIHDALIAVMVERDEAQAQLTGERVFHTHELDKERMKVEMLEKKVEYLKKVNIDESAAAFFLGQVAIPNGKIEQSMVQNVDAELLELCRQLSNEISMRVSSELEVLRLKESQKIQREVERKERAELEAQRKYYKDKMEKALAERDMFQQEVEKWKKSFEIVISVDPTSKLHS